MVQLVLRLVDQAKQIEDTAVFRIAIVAGQHPACPSQVILRCFIITAQVFRFAQGDQGRRMLGIALQRFLPVSVRRNAGVPVLLDMQTKEVEVLRRMLRPRCRQILPGFRQGCAAGGRFRVGQQSLVCLDDPDVQGRTGIGHGQSRRLAR